MSVPVVAIYGSPRKGSSSSELHDAFLKPIMDAGIQVKIFHTVRSRFSPCTGCGQCAGGPCMYTDDVTALYRDLMNCSMLSVSSPVYFSGLPGGLKSVVDRCQFIWERRDEVRPKSAFFISTAGSSYKTVFTGSLVNMKHFFNTLKASWDEKDSLLVPSMDSLIRPSHENMAFAAEQGRKYAEMLLKETGK